MKRLMGSARAQEGRMPAVRAKGSALIVAMAIVVLLASMCVVLLNEMRTRSTRAQVELEDIKAFEAAEAGVDAAIQDINSTRTVPLMINGKVVLSPDKHPINVHDPSLQPGCLGTRTQTDPGTGTVVAGSRDWKPPSPRNSTSNLGDDIYPIGPRPVNYIPRPNWLNQPMLDASGNMMTDAAGNPRFHEDGIVPVSLGDVAFYTYTIDWLWDGIDNNVNGRGADLDGDGQVTGMEIDPTERNKYTIFSTGIHRGLVKAGVTEEGRVITVEVNIQAIDSSQPVLPTGPLEQQIKPKVP